MSDDVQVYFTHRELHMCGACVAVCWNVRKDTVTTRTLGTVTTVTRLVRTGDPYIDFVWMREDAGGTWYEDEDSAVDGGLSVAAATQLQTELAWAIAYCAAQDTTKEETLHA